MMSKKIPLNVYAIHSNDNEKLTKLEAKKQQKKGTQRKSLPGK